MTWLRDVDDAAAQRVSALAPCPAWCELEHDHDVDEVLVGDEGRLHRATFVAGALDFAVRLAWSDLGEAEPWSAFAGGEQGWEAAPAASPAALAAQLRDAAAALERAAAWLDGR